MYPVLLGIMYFSLQFERTYLSKDIFIVKRSIFGDNDDILIQKRGNGTIFAGRIWDVCFSENLYMCGHQVQILNFCI